MRVLIGLVAVVLLLAVCGWITFSWNGNRASVNVETEKIEEDSQHIVDEGRDLIEGVSKSNNPAVPREDSSNASPAIGDPSDPYELERRE
jgi:hypothetical protein